MFFGLFVHLCVHVSGTLVDRMCACIAWEEAVSDQHAIDFCLWLLRFYTVG